MSDEAPLLGRGAPRGGCWPTEEEGLLLRACLLEGGSALEAWKEWKSRVNIDDLDQGSRRLLPLLYRNLSTLGVESPLMGTFKGLYRLAWYKNQTLLREAGEIIRSFLASGIQTMALKGASLIPINYQDYGLRPMNEIDLLVQTEQALAGAELLTKLGWRPTYKEPSDFGEPLVSAVHGEAFTGPEGEKLNLLWYLMPEGCYENADNDFWDAAVTVDFHGTTTRALNPTDELLLACVRGAAWSPVRTHLWAADSMMILRTTGPGVDWDRLVTQTQRRRLILQIKNALVCLRDLLDAPVPSEVVETLRSMGVSRIERIEYAAAISPDGATGALPTTWFRFLRSRQLEGSAPLRAGFLGFPSYLKVVWGLKHLWQVPICALSKALRRVS